jgi:signal transduction histidine kinase
MSSYDRMIWETATIDIAAITRRAAGRATHGLRDSQTWRATGYVTMSFFSLVGLFLLTMLALIVSLPLALVGIGVPLLAGTLTLVHRLAGFERRRAGWVGERIALRSLISTSIRQRIQDTVAWRHIGFAMVAWFVATILFAALVVVWAAPLFLISVPMWAWALDTPWTRIAVTPVLGVGLLCLSPYGAQGIGWLLRRFVEVQIGPDKVAEMEKQVSEISESRSEILTAVAGERRRIERNLHDGVQQQLVALGIDIGLAQAKLDSDPEAARALLTDATKKTRESIGELRTIGRGLHPAILGDRGLDAALSAVVANSPIPVDLRSDLIIDPPVGVAEAAYFVVSEALTNVMKHSKARLAVVDARSTDHDLTVSVYDDGRGGATMDGTGLAGIAARVRAFDGSFELTSPSGGPTVMTVTIPYQRNIDVRSGAGR